MRLLLIFAGVAVAISGAVAGLSDLDIHCTPKETDAAGRKSTTHGAVNKEKEHWAYDLSIENKTFKDMTGLEVKYIVFIKKEKLGSKDPASVERKKGTSPLDLKSHEKKMISTEPVEITKAKLAADWYYADYARRDATDSLVGCWVRVFQGGQQIGEYANPSSLTKEKWD